MLERAWFVKRKYLDFRIEAVNAVLGWSQGRFEYGGLDRLLILEVLILDIALNLLALDSSTFTHAN